MLPAAYILVASVILVVLFAYRPATTWPGLVIVVVGAAVYAVFGRRGSAASPRSRPRDKWSRCRTGRSA